MKQVIIFLYNVQQLNLLLDHYPDLLNTGRLIALDLDVSARLKMLGCVHEEMTALLTPAEVDALRREAVQLSQTWYQDWEQEASYAGFKLPPLDRYGVTWFFTEALVARALFQQACAAGMPSEMILIDIARKPTVWGTAAPDTAHGVWRFLAEQHGITITTLALPPAPLSSAKKLAKLDIVRTARDLLLNPLLWGLLPGLRRRRDVLMLVYYLEASRYDAIAERLEQRLGARFSKLTMDAVHKMQFPESRSAWQPLPTFHPFGDRLIARQKLHKVYAHWMQQRSAYQGDHPELFANPHLYGKFKQYIVRRLTVTAEITALAKRLFKIYRPKVVLVTGGAVSHQPEIVAAAEQQGIRVLTLPHSGMPTHPDLTITGDQAIVWTNDFVRWWTKAGVEQQRLTVAGLPKQIIYQGYRQMGMLPPVSQAERVVLVLLSRITLDLIPYADMRAHYDTLLALACLPEHLSGKVRLIFKVHPGSDYEYFYKHIQAQSPTPEAIIVIKTTPLEELLQTADAVVLVNMPSSSYLLALMEQKPLLYIRTTDLPALDFALAEWGDEAVIRQREEIWTTLEQTLFSEDYRQRILAANRAYWAQISPVEDRDPLDKICEIVVDHVNGMLHD